MADDADLDAICADTSKSSGSLWAIYLLRIDGRLWTKCPSTFRAARAALPQQTEAAVREILEGLGTPREIAASAELEGGKPLPPHSRNPILIGAAVAVVLVVIGVGIAAFAGAFTRSTPSSVQNIFAHRGPRQPGCLWAQSPFLQSPASSLQQQRRS